MIIYQSIPVTKHKSFNYTKTLRSVIAFLTMSGRSYWDLLSSEPQVRWKARPALLWVLLQKSCTEQKPMRLNRMSQNVNFVDWLTKKNIFFRCLKLWFFSSKTSIARCLDLFPFWLFSRSNSSPPERPTSLKSKTTRETAAEKSTFSS